MAAASWSQSLATELYSLMATYCTTAGTTQRRWCATAAPWGAQQATHTATPALPQPLLVQRLWSEVGQPEAELGLARRCFVSRCTGVSVIEAGCVGGGVLLPDTKMLTRFVL